MACRQEDDHNEAVEASTGEAATEGIPSSVSDRLDRARALKLEGNELFKKKEWKKAMKKYHSALMYCKGIADKLDSIIPGLAATRREKPTSEQEREAMDVMIAVTNNLAACLTHEEKWERVILHTDKVLKAQPDNIKALYRRGVARLKLGLLEEAEKDFVTGKNIDSKDKDIIMKLEEVHRRQREYTEKEKKIYAAMLNT